jgi:hypothetical protein
VHLDKLLEVMSTSVYTGLNLFNLIPKHFLQTYVRKCAVPLNTVKQQHISTATLILTTKSTYHSVSAQRLFEHSVVKQRYELINPKTMTLYGRFTHDSVDLQLRFRRDVYFR